MSSDLNFEARFWILSSFCIFYHAIWYDLHVLIFLPPMLFLNINVGGGGERDSTLEMRLKYKKSFKDVIEENKWKCQDIMNMLMNWSCSCLLLFGIKLAYLSTVFFFYQTPCRFCFYVIGTLQLHIFCSMFRKPSNIRHIFAKVSL